MQKPSQTTAEKANTIWGHTRQNTGRVPGYPFQVRSGVASSQLRHFGYCSTALRAFHYYPLPFQNQSGITFFITHYLKITAIKLTSTLPTEPFAKLYSVLASKEKREENYGSGREEMKTCLPAGRAV